MKSGLLIKQVSSSLSSSLQKGNSSSLSPVVCKKKQQQATPSGLASASPRGIFVVLDFVSGGTLDSLLLHDSVPVKFVFRNNTTLKPTEFTLLTR